MGLKETAELRLATPIKSAELRSDNVFIEAANGDVWRFWISKDDTPNVELIRRGYETDHT
jgi:hypothetical protein